MKFGKTKAKKTKHAPQTGGSGAGPLHQIVKASAMVRASMLPYKETLRGWSVELQNIAHQMGIRGPNLMEQIHRILAEHAMTSKVAKEAHDAFEAAAMRLAEMRAIEAPTKSGGAKEGSDKRSSKTPAKLTDRELMNAIDRLQRKDKRTKGEEVKLIALKEDRGRRIEVLRATRKEAHEKEKAEATKELARQHPVARVAREKAEPKAEKPPRPRKKKAPTA